MLAGCRGGWGEMYGGVYGAAGVEARHVQPLLLGCGRLCAKASMTASATQQLNQVQPGS